MQIQKTHILICILFDLALAQVEQRVGSGCGASGSPKTQQSQEMKSISCSNGSGLLSAVTLSTMGQHVRTRVSSTSGHSKSGKVIIVLSVGPWKIKKYLKTRKETGKAKMSIRRCFLYFGFDFGALTQVVEED